MTGCGAKEQEKLEVVYTHPEVEEKKKTETQDVKLNFGERAVAENYTLELHQAVVQEDSYEGQVYIHLVYECTNTSSEDLTINYGNFEGYADDYLADNSSYIEMEATKSLKMLSGTIATGKKIKGFVAYRVPEDFQVVECRYTDKDGNHVTYVIQRDQFVESDRVN